MNADNDPTFWFSHGPFCLLHFFHLTEQTVINETCQLPKTHRTRKIYSKLNLQVDSHYIKMMTSFSVFLAHLEKRNTEVILAKVVRLIFVPVFAHVLSIFPLFAQNVCFVAFMYFHSNAYRSLFEKNRTIKTNAERISKNDHPK